MKKFFNIIGFITSIPVVLATSFPVNAWEPSDYEIWIVSKKLNGEYCTKETCPEVGHAWVAVVYKDAMNYWAVDSTVGFWTDGKKWNRERDETAKIIKGQSISPRGWAVRKMKATKSRADWFKKNAVNQTVCEGKGYWFDGTIGCNCVTFARNAWYEGTAYREFFWTDITPSPDTLVDKINQKNRELGSDFIDYGARWQ